MTSSITSSNTILTLAIASFLFILVDILCEFAMLPGIYILLFPQEKRCTILPDDTDEYKHSAPHSSKRFKPLSDVT